MLGPYIAALLFGGVLLALSLVAGGDDGDHDHDAGDGGHDHDHAHDVGTLGAVASTFASLRFWTFFLAFGGGTGAALSIAAVNAVLTGIVAGGAGLVAGLTAAMALRYLGREDVTSALSAEEWIGRTAKVTVPVSASRPGKVLLSFENEVKELVALAAGESEGSLDVGDEVIVVSMTDGVAKVTSNRLAAGPAKQPQKTTT